MTRARPQLRVALVDDLEQVAADLRKILQAAPGFQLSAWYPTAAEAIRRIPDDPPDLLLMDLELGGPLNGIDCIAALSERLPGLKIVAYTVFEDVDNILTAIQRGATGYLLKDTAPELLLAELKAMHLGGAPLTPRVAEKIIRYAQGRDSAAATDAGRAAEKAPRKYLRRTRNDPDDAALSSTPQPAETGAASELSAREIEILNCVSVGMKYPRIAESLGISVHTVRRHIEKIYEKLGVHSRLAAVLTGRRIGLVRDGGRVPDE